MDSLAGSNAAQSSNLGIEMILKGDTLDLAVESLTMTLLEELALM